MTSAAFHRLTASDRRALTLGSLVLIALLGYAKVIKPAWSTLANERRSLADERSLLARERALISAAPSLPQRQHQTDQILASSRTRLFEGDSVAASAALTSYVAQVATATGVHLTTIETRTPATERSLVRLSVDVRGEGTWRQILTFVRLLEVSGQLIDITSLRLDRGPRGGPLGGEQVSLAASLAGYTRAP